jgi:pyridoxine/pyridoxamine 5'-phosphate oxidase
MTTISNSQYFEGTLFSPVHVEGQERPLNRMVRTYWAVRPDRSEVVACANIASARAISEGRAPNKVDETTYTYKAVPFVSPTGQYYVEIYAGSQVVRMDVANAQTARHYAKNGVGCELATAAYVAHLRQ